MAASGDIKVPSFADSDSVSYDVGDALLRGTHSSSAIAPTNASVSTQDCANVEFDIKGMSCAACVANIERNVGCTDGIVMIRVALIGEKASVVFDEAKLSKDDIQEMINGLGYKATELSDSRSGTSITFLLRKDRRTVIRGPEIDYISSALFELPGVLNVDVASTTEGPLAVAIQYDASGVSGEGLGPRDILKHIEMSGYDARRCRLAKTRGRCQRQLMVLLRTADHSGARLCLQSP